jgi:hypothetical protein
VSEPVIAHELGHTLFYDWTQIPFRQLLPPSAAEEAFCYAFAEAPVTWLYALEWGELVLILGGTPENSAVGRSRK